MGKHRDNDIPLISIITVTLNAVNHLEHCIKSVINQKYPRIEHVILDGGSTDGTLEILTKYNSNLAFWKCEPDKGIYNAMNKALHYIHGNWVLFLGADDVLFEGFSQMAFNLKKTNCIYYGMSKWKDKISGKKFTAYMLTKGNICHQSIFYPIRVFEKYHYDERYKVRADYVLNMQLWKDSDFSKQFFPILIVNYASGGFSAQHQDTFFTTNKSKIIRKHFGLFVFLHYKIKKIKNRLRNLPGDNELW